jgi:hypothetical protein
MINVCLFVMKIPFLSLQGQVGAAHGEYNAISLIVTSLAVEKYAYSDVLQPMHLRSVLCITFLTPHRFLYASTIDR